MEEKTTKQLLEEVNAKLTEKSEKEKIKSKKFKLPFWAKLKRRHLRQGYVTVEKIDDNKNISFTRVPIIDGTIQLDEGQESTYHAVDVKDIFFYKGKPFVHQAKRRLNPFNPLEEEHQTYGQKYIMAKMLKDQIKEAKAKFRGGMLFVIIIAIIAGIYYFSKRGGAA